MPKVRKMLGAADSPYIVSLMRFIETQSKKTLVDWGVGYAETHFLPVYEAVCVGDTRPREALQAARDWMAGLSKLPAAKEKILACHAAAREAEANPAAQAAARAVGQAASIVHAPTHALGLAFYGAAALAYHRVGLSEPAAVYDQMAAGICADIEAALRAVAVENEQNPVRVHWNC